jgi:hypothetical protein
MAKTFLISLTGAETCSDARIWIHFDVDKCMRRLLRRQIVYI